jgi:hypothetical protein
MGIDDMIGIGGSSQAAAVYVDHIDIGMDLYTSRMAPLYGAGKGVETGRLGGMGHKTGVVQGISVPIHLNEQNVHVMRHHVIHNGLDLGVIGARPSGMPHGPGFRTDLGKSKGGDDENQDNHGKKSVITHLYFPPLKYFGNKTLVTSFSYKIIFKHNFLKT